MNLSIPRLSVVIPVYNPHQYLEPCLNSILKQTFKDFELIVIDDSSSDGSYELLRTYANKDKRIRVLQNKRNLGAARTRNEGLHIALGEYITFLDADDFFEKDFFERMLNKAEQYNADVALCAFYRWDARSGKEKIKWPAPPKKLKNLLQGVFSPRDLGNRVFNLTSWAPYTKVLRRKFILDNGLEFQNLTSCNDLYFGVMVCACARRMVYISDGLVHYRLFTGFQISTGSLKNAGNGYWAVKSIYEGLKQRNLLSEFSQAYYPFAMDGCFFALENYHEFDSNIKHVLADVGIEHLDEESLQRLTYRNYGQYQLLHQGIIVSGNIIDIVTCLLTLMIKGHWAAVYWIVGHYVMKKLRNMYSYQK